MKPPKVHLRRMTGLALMLASATQKRTALRSSCEAGPFADRNKHHHCNTMISAFTHSNCPTVTAVKIGILNATRIYPKKPKSASIASRMTSEVIRMALEVIRGTSEVIQGTSEVIRMTSDVERMASEVIRMALEVIRGTPTSHSNGL